jgi:CRP-like cAMP-binding protein
MVSPEAVHLLKEAPLFAQFSEKELEAVLSTAKERHFEADKPIVREGDAGGVGFYLILDGQVEVRKGRKVLAKLGAGEFFGEMALFDDSARSADVVALKKTKCCMLTRWDLRGLIGTHPDIALKMLAELAKRLRETNQALSE